MKTDICIIGGGVIGLYSAYALHSRGLKVAVIDRGEFGMQCTAAAGGILSPLLPWDYSKNINDLCRHASPLYKKLGKQLLSQTGIDIEYEINGLMVIADEYADTHKIWCRNNQIVTESANHSDKQISSQLIENSLLLPELSQLNPRRLVEGLCQYLLDHGVVLYKQTEVDSLLQQQGQVTGIECRHGEINAKAVLWATGAWAAELALLGNQIKAPEVRPIRGQAIAFDGQGINLDHILIHKGHYLLQRKDGSILAGSTLEDVGYNNDVTEPAKNDLLERSISIIPKLKDQKILRQWSGLRPASINKEPLIGAVGTIAGLFINSGHHRYGITMAPSSAEQVADQIMHYLITADNPEVV
jgi:glycine oxidase